MIEITRVVLRIVCISTLSVGMTALFWCHEGLSKLVDMVDKYV